MSETTGLSKGILLKVLGWFDTPLERIVWNLIILAIFSTLYRFFVKIDDNGIEKELNIEEAIYHACSVHFTAGLIGLKTTNRSSKIIYIAHILIIWIINLVPIGCLKYFESDVPIHIGMATMSGIGYKTTDAGSQILNQALERNLRINQERRSSLISS